jgi:hypothetical protein
MCAAESSERWSERQAENMVLVQCDRDNPLVALGKQRHILDILREGSDRKTYPNWHGICKAAADEIERLREERDEARRMICVMLSRMSMKSQHTPEWSAKNLGWDCFKKGTA